jgi:hypothetical protein
MSYNSDFYKTEKRNVTRNWLCFDIHVKEIASYSKWKPKLLYYGLFL